MVLRDYYTEKPRRFYESLLEDQRIGLGPPDGACMPRITSCEVITPNHIIDYDLANKKNSKKKKH